MPRFKTFEDHQRFLETFTTEELVQQCLDRLSPILTHKQPVSSMSIPVDFEQDDDAYICERLRQIKRRVSPAREEQAK